MAFELSSVAVAVGGRNLLAGVDVRLDGPGLLGLIGHNGSGKSTLLRILARQLRPSAGEVRFGGRPLRDWGAREFARALAYLPQDPPAAPGMRVRDLVGLGRYAWHGPLGRFGCADRDAVDSALERTDTAGLADRLIAELSGGERQRCWIAMCLAQQASWLLLDEPTAALDLKHQRHLLDLLHRLVVEDKLGVIVVMHDINLAARSCSELLALRAGRIAARGTAGAVMNADTLRAIYAVDLGLLPHPAGGPPVAYLP